MSDWKLKTHLTLILMNNDPRLSVDGTFELLGMKDVVLDDVLVPLVGAAQTVVVDRRGGVLQSMPLVQIDTKAREVTLVASVRVIATENEKRDVAFEKPVEVGDELGV